jgi:uracil phosphoribosyltransferase
MPTDKYRVLSLQPSIFNQYLAEMRDAELQQDRMRFRTNVSRASEILAYEVSKLLTYETETIQTPLGVAEEPVLDDAPVLACILRAGLPMHEGFLRMFDKADSAFISAYRKHSSETKFMINVEYVSCPSLWGRDLILLDPMIATGSSMVQVYEALAHHGTPRNVYICGIIGSEQGVEYVRRHLPQAHLIVGTVDAELTAKSYIVPGLGDAGDLAFGEKESKLELVSDLLSEDTEAYDTYPSADAGADADHE